MQFFRIWYGYTETFVQLLQFYLFIALSTQTNNAYFFMANENVFSVMGETSELTPSK